LRARRIENCWNITEIVALVALVALHSVTNFFNDVFDPEKDSRAVTPAGSI
jgi:1,4-dihydroxy-2-naphthoate octaprenyltransferase